jgi:hypothetical protein
MDMNGHGHGKGVGREVVLGTFLFLLCFLLSLARSVFSRSRARR